MRSKIKVSRDGPGGHDGHHGQTDFDKTTLFSYGFCDHARARRSDGFLVRFGRVDFAGENFLQHFGVLDDVGVHEHEQPAQKNYSVDGDLPVGAPFSAGSAADPSDVRLGAMTSAPG